MRIRPQCMICKQVLNYLVDFLIGPVYTHVRDPEVSKLVHPRSVQLIRYTDRAEEMRDAVVVIRPSSFFNMDVYGTELIEPKLPLAQWEGIPLLFGEGRHEWINEGKTLLLHADIIASAYYLMSRYEEMYRRDVRDEHGRFPGKVSLPYRAGFIHRPIIDEYGHALRRLLSESGILDRLQAKLEERPPYFAQINLTHDVDQPYLYRGIGGYLRGVYAGEGLWRMFKVAFGSPYNDPFFTFGEFLEWNKQLREDTPAGVVNTILFFKTPDRHPLDKPNYSLQSRYMRLICALAKRSGALYGLHCSYQSGIEPARIAVQLKKLERTLRAGHIARSRHHYLAQREPEDMYELMGAGIRHDYTMGYADVAGFRLGTCRAVRFINPNTRSLTDLVMHPLTIMDVTLSRPDYMNMSQEEATQYACDLVRATARYHGELNLLWHNEQFSPRIHPWHAKLYRTLLDIIREIEAEDPREKLARKVSSLEEISHNNTAETLGDP